MKSYLTVEAPNTKATVDFLSEAIGVELSIENGKLRIVAMMMHGETTSERKVASTWDQHEAEWPLPKRGS
jgi:hypothetical protein